MIKLKVNGQTHHLDLADPAMPLLWLLRDRLNLVGTKFGCGIGQCGACTVLLNGRAVRSCLLTVTDAAQGEITTVEGLAAPDGSLHPLQRAWIDEDVAQCGYCQAGQLMSASALLDGNPTPSDAEIDKAMAGNLCRCATYLRIRKAIKSASTQLSRAGSVQVWESDCNQGSLS